MAARQNAYRFAWCVEIVGPATVRGATVDLPEAAAIAAFGEPQRGRITTVGPITTALPNLFYGVRRESGTTITLDNRDGAIDPTEDWRLAPFTLWHFDRELGVKREELTGIVTAAEFVNARVTFTLGTVNDGILHDLLPAATIDPATGSPFDDSASPGAPIPVVFGSNVLVRLPSLNVSNTNEAIVSSWDYAAGFGSELRVEALYGDIDTQRPGLEVYGSWTGVPGSPTYSNPSLFTVTGDQSNRFAVGLPIRFKTTTGGGAFRYSAVKAYHAAPPRVEIIHPLLDAGPNTVQVIGDFAS